MESQTALAEKYGIVNPYEVLRNSVEQVVKLDEPEWNELREMMQLVEVPKGEFLYREGDLIKHIWFTVKGALRVYLEKDGRQITVIFSHDGHFTGDYAAFFPTEPTIYFSEAVCDSLLLSLKLTDLEMLYTKYKSMERWGRISMQYALEAKVRREISLMLNSAEERFMRLWNESPHCFQYFAQKDLASYLGMSPETFSRIRKRMPDLIS